MRLSLILHQIIIGRSLVPDFYYNLTTAQGNSIKKTQRGRMSYCLVLYHNFFIFSYFTFYIDIYYR
jgi:hypothetical protein